MKSPGSYGWGASPPVNREVKKPKKELEPRITESLYIWPGQEIKVCMVPDKEGHFKPYQIGERAIKLDGDWRNLETIPPKGEYDWVEEHLMSDFDFVKNCMNEYSGDYCVNYFTVYVFPYKYSYESKKTGKMVEVEVKPQIKAVCAKPKAFTRMFLEENNRRGNLAWSVYSWKRLDREDFSACGSSWHFEEQLRDGSSLEPPENFCGKIACINWNEFLKVKSIDELEAKYGDLAKQLKQEAENKKKGGARKSVEQVNYS